MRIRIKFTKEECVKYLGHLDIMRAFQKCMNRAQIKMTYSEGFSPHQKMSFALPLGVGITSKAEYMDCEIADGQDLSEIKDNLNKVCGPGFTVLSVKELEEGAVKAMAAVKYADFAIDFANSYENEQNMEGSKEKGVNSFANSLNSAQNFRENMHSCDYSLMNSYKDLTHSYINFCNLSSFLAQEKIITLKKSKSGTKEEDIKSMIISAKILGGKLIVRLTAGSINNLKAETFLAAFHEFIKKSFDKYEFSIERLELLSDDFTALENFGTK